MSADVAELPVNPPCGGITVNGAWPPPCCEVHVLPWGHDRRGLGLLAGAVQPDEADLRKCGVLRRTAS